MIDQEGRFDSVSVVADDKKKAWRGQRCRRMDGKGEKK